MVGGLGDCLIIICSKEWSTRSGSGITGILIRTVDPLGPSLSIGLPVTTSLLKQHRRYAQNDRHSNLFIGGFGTWIAHDVACKRGFTKLICFKVQVISVYIYIYWCRGITFFWNPTKRATDDAKAHVWERAANGACCQVGAKQLPVRRRTPERGELCLSRRLAIYLSWQTLWELHL